MSMTTVEEAGLGSDAGRIFDGAHRRLTLGIVTVVLLVAFEAMAVATVMPVAVRELDGLALYAWAFSGFLSASLFAMVVAGEVSDRTGPRLPLLAGVAVFGVGLVLAGTAQSMLVFVLGRAVQGLGGGAIIVALYVVVARCYPESLRPRVFSAMSAGWVLPSIIGPAVAGVVADNLSWRWVFLAVPVLIAPAVIVMLPRLGGGRATGEEPRRRSRRVLALGAAVGAALLQYAGQHLTLASLLLLVVAGTLLVPTVPRLLPAGALAFRRGLPTTVVMRGVLAGAFFGAETFVPLMLVTERDLSTTFAGLSLTGGALGWALGSWYQGRPSTRLARPTLIRLGSGLVAVGIGGAALALWPAVPVLVAGLGWTVGGLGMGMAMASVSVLTLEQSPLADQGANSAALQVSDALFSIVFIGIGGAIFAGLHAGAGLEQAAFLAIFAVMAALAVLGAVVARRVRPLTAAD